MTVVTMGERVSLMRLMELGARVVSFVLRSRRHVGFDVQHGCCLLAQTRFFGRCKLRVELLEFGCWNLCPQERKVPARRFVLTDLTCEIVSVDSRDRVR
jgi:hypothetical protein